MEIKKPPTSDPSVGRYFNALTCSHHYNDLVLQLIGSQSPPVSIQSENSAEPANKLHILLGHYQSDEEDQKPTDTAEESFQDFMAEVKAIEPADTPSASSKLAYVFFNYMR